MSGCNRLAGIPCAFPRSSECWPHSACATQELWPRALQGSSEDADWGLLAHEPRGRKAKRHPGQPHSVRDGAWQRPVAPARGPCKSGKSGSWPAAGPSTKPLIARFLPVLDAGRNRPLFGLVAGRGVGLLLPAWSIELCWHPRLVERLRLPEGARQIWSRRPSARPSVTHGCSGRRATVGAVSQQPDEEFSGLLADPADLGGAKPVQLCPCAAEASAIWGLPGQRSEENEEECDSEGKDIHLGGA